MRERGSYTRPAVARLVTRFAAIAVATQREWSPIYERSTEYEAQLADVENALGRMPYPLYEALTLRGLEGRTNASAAAELRVHANTMSRRYMRGLRWLRQWLNAPREIPMLRTVAWREWAWANDDVVLQTVAGAAPPGSGRYPATPPEVDKRVLELHCAGSTEREIAEILNAECQRDRAWTRSSVRSVLRRYQAPKRPTGKRPHPFGSYRVTRSDYREIMFGEPLCDPCELLERTRQRQK